jgi:hypothetical protein
MVPGVAVLLAAVGLAGVPTASAQVAAPEGFDQSAPEGLTLESDRETISSALRVDLTFEYATLPLHKGTADGETVWFVVTDVSDADVAREMGVNHAPKLANVPTMCPACSQEVTTSDPTLGEALVEFQGAPDFSLTRTLDRGPAEAPFPAQSSTPGAMGRADYSPYVTVGDSPIVFNAPIIATGDGPFDVTTHTDTHDRTLGIDTIGMTTDQLFVRGFANGEPILYLSFDVSDAFTAMIERSTFVPALFDLGFPNGGGRSDSARASIFTFVNAMVGLEAPSPRGASDGPGRSQGLTHALSFPIAEQDAAIANPDVIEGLRNGGDVSNIFDAFPTLPSERSRAEYSPAWDLQVGVYSDAAVAAGLNGLQTDANEIRRLARRGLVTGPGGRPHTARGGDPSASANVVINCPALAFLEERPVTPRIPLPGRPPTTLRATQFTDVPGGHPHAESIAAIDRSGVSTGYADRTFRPDQQVTRGQMASFLVRALDLPPGTATFSDVPSTHTHRAAIAALATAGITAGFTDGTFRPDEPVARGQMASFLAAAIDLDAPVLTQAPFSDVGLDHPHGGAIAAVLQAGIASGFEDGTFRPEQGVTRAQMATFLARALIL